MLDICWHYTSTWRELISGASPTTRISRYSPTRTIHNAPPTSRVDKLPAANPYASQIDTIARDSTNGSLEEYLDASGTTAFLVIHDDELLYEKYFDGYDKNSIQTSFSMAKSFALALVGIAIDEGHIKSIDEPITNYIPELLEKDKRFGSITIRNLLTMSSGRTGCVARYSDGKGCSPGKQG